MTTEDQLADLSAKQSATMSELRKQITAARELLAGIMGALSHCPDLVESKRQVERYFEDWPEHSYKTTVWDTDEIIKREGRNTQHIQGKSLRAGSHTRIARIADTRKAQQPAHARW